MIAGPFSCRIAFCRFCSLHHNCKNEARNADAIDDPREVRPRKDHRGVDLISDVLLFGRLWYGEPNAISNAIGYAPHAVAHTML
jgi:hypothetical protein